MIVQLHRLIDLRHYCLIAAHVVTYAHAQVIESSLKFGRQLDSDHIPLQHFFIVLEHVLRHGVRPKKVFREI